MPFFFNKTCLISAFCVVDGVVSFQVQNQTKLAFCSKLFVPLSVPAQCALSRRSLRLTELPASCSAIINVAVACRKL